jgi:diguanylate cyclase (GGDEF)-like protein
MDGGTTLARDGSDRERMLDMDRRLRPVRRLAFGIIALALLACGPWLGWWTVVPVAVAAIVYRVLDSQMDRLANPEYVIFGAWVGAQVIIAISVALTGGAEEATMSWFAIPIITLASRFSARGIVAGVAITIGLMLAVAFGVDAQAVIDNPPVLIAPLTLVIAVTIFSIALMQSDLDHRSEAVIDPLTGMLNRKALESRAEELEQQSLLSGEPVGVLVGDLDKFKSVNDSFGHNRGDAALKDVAYALRKQLRAFDLAYRIGGEEFLILLPGAELAEAAAIAENLRKAVSSEEIAGGLRLTMSFGVGASQRGEPFDYEAVFANADAALYAAKAAGRDCVRRGRGERQPDPQAHPEPAPAV